MTDMYIVRAKAKKTYGMAMMIIHVANEHDLIEPMQYNEWHKLDRAEQVKMGYNLKRAKRLKKYYDEHGLDGYDSYKTEVVPV